MNKRLNLLYDLFKPRSIGARLMIRRVLIWADKHPHIPQNGIIMNGEILEATPTEKFTCDGCKFNDRKIYDVCKYNNFPCYMFHNGFVIFKEWKGGEE